MNLYAKNVREYHGPSQIKIVNGSNLPVRKIGDITKAFKNIFVLPKLSTSIILVDQLVDNNCNVIFSHNFVLCRIRCWGL